jgi:hypothetical protein
MKALISTTETRQTGYRVAEVAYDDQTFPLAETMFWVDFPSEFNAEQVPNDAYWFDPTDNTIKLNPQEPDITEA